MAEFRMLEAECAFMDSLEQLLVLVEDYLKYVVRRMNEEHPEEFEACKSVCEQGNSANPSEKVNFQNFLLIFNYLFRSDSN